MGSVGDEDIEGEWEQMGHREEDGRWDHVVDGDTWEKGAGGRWGRVGKG